MDNVNLIEIMWEGPYSIEELQGDKGKDIHTSYGLYQIYGHHPVYGSDALLYLGMSQKYTFSSRFRDEGHGAWTKMDADTVKIYIGHLGCLVQPISTPEDNDWEFMIKTAESLLIYSLGPAYNSQEIKEISKEIRTGKYIVLNHGKRKALPGTVSSFWVDGYKKLIEGSSQEFSVFKWKKDEVK